MRENINKVSQRGERLDSLQDKTDNLAVSAQGFRRGANRVRKQMWWKDFKMRICLVAGIIILLVIIIVPSGRLTIHTTRKPEPSPSPLYPRYRALIRICSCLLEALVGMDLGSLLLYSFIIADVVAVELRSGFGQLFRPTVYIISFLCSPPWCKCFLLILPVSSHTRELV